MFKTKKVKTTGHYDSAKIFIYKEMADYPQENYKPVMHANKMKPFIE